MNEPTKLNAPDTAIARRVMEVLPLLTELSIEEAHQEDDRLALRIAFELLLEHVVRPEDDERALRIEGALREAMR